MGSGGGVHLTHFAWVTLAALQDSTTTVPYGANFVYDDIDGDDAGNEVSKTAY